MGRSQLARFMVPMAVLALVSACGGKTAAPDTAGATVASPTAAPTVATVAAPADSAVAAAPDTAPEAPEVAVDAAPESPDAVAAGTPEAAAPSDDAAPTAPAEDIAAALPDADAQAANTDDAAAGTDKVFAQMSDEEKKDFMKKVVLPKVRPAFQTADPKDFAKFGCVTCHGPNARETKFKMPNPKLPKLPTTSEGFKKLYAKKGKMMDFMKNELTPMMVELLHEKPFDMKTGQGFGCFECHTKE